MREGAARAEEAQPHVRVEVKKLGDGEQKKESFFGWSQIDLTGMGNDGAGNEERKGPVVNAVLDTGVVLERENWNGSVGVGMNKDRFERPLGKMENPHEGCG